MGVLYHSKGINTQAYLYNNGIKDFYDNMWWDLQLLFSLGGIHISLKILNSHPPALNIIILELQIHSCHLCLYHIPWWIFECSLGTNVYFGASYHFYYTTPHHPILCTILCHHTITKPKLTLFILVNIKIWFMYLWSRGCSFNPYIQFCVCSF